MLANHEKKSYYRSTFLREKNKQQIAQRNTGFFFFFFVIGVQLFLKTKNKRYNISDGKKNYKLQGGREAIAAPSPPLKPGPGYYRVKNPDKRHCTRCAGHTTADLKIWLLISPTITIDQKKKKNRKRNTTPSRRMFDPV